MTEGSGVWLLGVQAMAVLVLVTALADAVLALASRARRLRYQDAAYRSSLRTLEDTARAASVRRIDREDENLSWSGFRKFCVARRVDESEDVCSLYLEPHDRKAIPSYRPGQYLTFAFRIPGERRPVVRCYSLSDAPQPDHFRISVKRVGAPASAPKAPPGKVSSYLHERVAPGDILDVKAPGGDFHLDLDKARPILLIGGGIGVTPVLAMLNGVAGRGFDREVWFFYGVRNPDELIMKAHLESLASAHPDRLHLHICYSDVDESDLPSRAPAIYHAERVSVDLLRRALPSNNFDFHLCGPPAMMSALTHDLRDWGVPDEEVFLESFGPASVKGTPRAERAASLRADIKVVFDRSGREAGWDPSAETLLAFAEANGVYIDRGCRAGSCGTCITAIKSGEIEYLTSPGAAPESNSCLTCIAVPKTNLVLDA